MTGSRTEFRGCGTALVTPFLPGGEVDWQALERLVDWQVDSGIDFLVPCGTTGESVSLDEEEYEGVVSRCVTTAAGRVPVLAGAGSNSTRHAVRLARLAQQAGADGVLSVTPYYNKPSQEGMVRHFAEVARAVAIPVVAYNVPARTGVTLLPRTVRELAGRQDIVGIKEAGGSLSSVMELLSSRLSGFRVLSGDDDLAMAATCIGADGVISVASNLIPEQMARLIRLCREGSLEEARRIHYHYLPLMKVNFLESNPIPVKYALACMGRIQARYRLPLSPPAPATRRRVEALLEQLELLVRA